jgi:glutathione S-transferase
MKIYGNIDKGNPRRVSIFLAEKGIEVPFQVVDLSTGEHRREPFLTKNPFSRVPVLELDDGTCISETIAICRYFESLYPQPPLFGIGALEQAVIEMWQRRVELEIFIPTSMFVRHTSPSLKSMQEVQIPAWGELCGERARDALRIMDRQLAKNEYVAGSAFSVADITLAHQLLGMPGTLGIKVPDDCPDLLRWLQQVYRRPSIHNTQPKKFGLIQSIQR